MFCGISPLVLAYITLKQVTKKRLIYALCKN